MAGTCSGYGYGHSSQVMLPGLTSVGVAPAPRRAAIARPLIPTTEAPPPQHAQQRVSFDGHCIIAPTMTIPAVVSRRNFLYTGAAAISATVMPVAAQPNRATASVKALVFDTFGTVVDWRSSVAGKSRRSPGGRACRSTARNSPTRGARATRRA